MTLRDAYVASVVGLFALVAVTMLLAFRQRSFRRFKTAELATLALLICLLYVAAIPWQIGLAKVPGVDALVFSIPYTAVLLLGLRLVPKPGAATVLVCGAGIFGQLLGRGLNPAWWPYYLWCGVSLDLYLMTRRPNPAFVPRDAGSGRAPWTLGLLVHVPDPGTFPVATVLRLVVCRSEGFAGGSWMRDRCVAGVATRAGHREGDTLRRSVSTVVRPDPRLARPQADPREPAHRGRRNSLCHWKNHLVLTKPHLSGTAAVDYRLWFAY